jgi:exosortase
MRSESNMAAPGLVVAAHALAFWPVWRWYLARTTDGSDEPWGIAALIVAVALTWPWDRPLRLEEKDPLLFGAVVLTLVYAILVPFAPPLVRSIVAMAALACSWVSITDARGKTPVIVALFVLSVPVIASMQFYAGYPLRALTTTVATGMLNVFGMSVDHAGTTMTSQGRSVLVDAPCSGVRMLWAGAFLACLLAAQRPSVSWRGIALVLALVLPVALAANAIRAALLFLLEVRAAAPPQYLHSLVGVGTFALAGSSLLAVEALARSRHPHRARAAGYGSLRLR